MTKRSIACNGASTLILVSADQRSPIPLGADCAAAMENMLLAAESIGLGSCWIFFVTLAFDSPKREESKRELEIPEGYKVFYRAVIGYKAETGTIAPDRKPDVVTYIR